MAVDLQQTRGGRVRPSMNITPLVDVVLVLLIIFMVVTPLMSRHLWVPVPPKVEDDAPPPPPEALPPLVLTLGADGVTRVNGQAIARGELLARLARMLNARPDKVVFFDADSEAPYGAAMALLDELRAGGVPELAVLAEPLGATAGPTVAGAP